MPLYKYDSFSRRGKRISGTIDAVSKQEAIELLRGQGLMPINLSETTQDQNGSFWTNLFKQKVDIRTKVIFTKQLSVLLKSGVPLLQAMELLTEQFEGEFKHILINIKDGIKAGESLASELNKYPRVFPSVYVQLVRAGEASGKLEIILGRLTIYLERTEETKKKIRKAMAYPIGMLTFALLVVIGVLEFLVPKIENMLKQFGITELPGPTQLLMDMSNIVRNNFILITIIFLATTITFTRWKATSKGKYKFDEFTLKFPLLSYFSKTKAVVQFSQTLGMLLESGVNLAQALDIVCKIVDNEVLRQRLLEARDNIIKEGKIAKYLKKTNIFPNIASYMISTGEESGKLAEMLLTVGKDYDTELTELTDSLTAKIAPIMMIVMAIVVLFIVLAIFLPIIGMTDAMGI